MVSCPLLTLLLLVAAVVASNRAGASSENGKTKMFNASSLELFVDELPDMPRFQGYAVKDGFPVAGNLTIGMYTKLWKFHRDLPPTRVFAYGTSMDTATVPGPTIEALCGVPTYITWINHLPSRHILPWDPTLVQPAAQVTHSGVKTVVHLHGGVHPPTSDGNSNAWFTSGFTTVGPAFAGPTSYYPNAQLPGNLWYHDHAMGLTRVNFLAGLFGAYILRSPDLETPLHLPSAPQFDRHLIIFDRSFRADGSIYMNATGDNPSIHPQWQPEYFGNVIIVNGKAWPYLSVRRRRYRFRIINASNARFFRLYFKDDPGLAFHHIGSDSNYIPRTVTSRRFLLAPSEIADVVIDFAASEANSAVLVSDAQYPYPGDPGDSTEELKAMKFVIRKRRKREVDTSRIPKRLLRYPPAEVHQAVARRYITMYEYESKTGEPVRLLLNALPFEAPATETPKEGSLEIWEVINLTEDNHPLHVHLGALRVLEQRELVDLEVFKACMFNTNDAKGCHVAERASGRTHGVPPHEAGWKNVFKMMPGVVTRILVRFRPLDRDSYGFNASTEPGYVYHCHILDHEDNAMMRPLKLVPSNL